MRLMMLIRLSSWVQSVTVLNCPVSPLSSLLSALCAPLSSHQNLSTTPLSTSFNISTHPSLFFVLVMSSFSSHSPHEFDCFSPPFSFFFLFFQVLESLVPNSAWLYQVLRCSCCMRFSTALFSFVQIRHCLSPACVNGFALFCALEFFFLLSLHDAAAATTLVQRISLASANALSLLSGNDSCLLQVSQTAFR